MSKPSKNIVAYKLPSETIRKNRQSFYNLHRRNGEQRKTWFERIQSVANCCKFARCRQFMIIDKFICELNANEVEQIKPKIDTWSLKQLTDYLVNDISDTKHCSSFDPNNEMVNTNQKLSVEDMKLVSNLH